MVLGLTLIACALGLLWVVKAGPDMKEKPVVSHPLGMVFIPLAIMAPLAFGVAMVIAAIRN